MRYRVFTAAAVLMMFPAMLPGQAKKLATVPPGTKVTISELVTKGQIDAAVKLAVKNPVAAEAAVNNLMGTADTDIVNRRISEALVVLGSTQDFVDACDKTGQVKKLPREALMGRHLRVQGIILNDQKEYVKAAEMLKQALVISQPAKDSALEAGIRNNLGYALQAQKLLGDAIKEFDTARKIAEEQKDDLRAGSYNFNLGTALLEQTTNDLAMAAFKRAAAQNRAAGRSNLEARSVLMQGVASSRINPQGEEALKLFTEAEAMFEKLGDDRNAGWAYFLMGDHVQAAMEYKKAIGFAEKALPFLTKINDKAGLLNCYELLEKMYGYMNEKEKAENYAKLAAELTKK